MLVKETKQEKYIKEILPNHMSGIGLNEIKERLHTDHWWYSCSSCDSELMVPAW
jgi:hypothetical protein